MPDIPVSLITIIHHAVLPLLYWRQLDAFCRMPAFMAPLWLLPTGKLSRNLLVMISLLMDYLGLLQDQHCFLAVLRRAPATMPIWYEAVFAEDAMCGRLVLARGKRQERHRSIVDHIECGSEASVRTGW